MDDETQTDTTHNGNVVATADSTNGAGVITDVSKDTPPNVAQTAEATEADDETKEVEETQKKYILTPKFNDWYLYYTNHKHYVLIKEEQKETYGNATLSAIKAYSLDPIKQYHVGSNIGHQNFRKCENLALEIAGKNGWTYETFLRHGWLNMLKTENPAWFDRMGAILGFHTPAPTVQVQNNTQINVGEAEQVNFNDSFRKWQESEK